MITRFRSVKEKRVDQLVPGDLMCHRGVNELWLVLSIVRMQHKPGFATSSDEFAIFAANGDSIYDIVFLTARAYGRTQINQWSFEGEKSLKVISHEKCNR